MAPHLLIVDDEEDIRLTLTELLEGEGYRVSTAGDGYEALTFLEDVTPNLILLDAMMPRMGGWEFLFVRERKPHLKAIPVIVMSANLDFIRKDSLSSFDRIGKPFDIDIMLRLIGKLAGVAPSLQAPLTG